MERNGNIGPRYAIRVSELRAWYVITATCFRCRHEASIPAATLTHSRPPFARLIDLERKLRCRRCGNREDNTFSVRLASRN